MRFMLGFTQAFCVIYGPVWVNEFSPRNSNTKWMAILHSFVVIGIMIGYIMGALTVTVLNEYLDWRFAFMIQGWFMILIGICFLFSSNSVLDIFALIKSGRGKSYSDAHRGAAISNHSDDTPHNVNVNKEKSVHENRSSIGHAVDHRHSVRMDTISL
jgi:MFS family permease